MTKLKDVCAWMDEELSLDVIPDYPGALNGLQLENGGSVSKVGAAVDASLPVMEKAVAEGVDLLLVHHGMFWQGTQRVTGPVYRKIKLAMDHGLAIYSAHIPLDVHPFLGNNACLARAIGMSDPEPFFDWKGIQLGLKQSMSLSREALLERVGRAVDAPVHHCPAGSDPVGTVGVITGGAGSEVAAVAECGVDTFITGEGPHWSYPLAEELGLNVFYAGHYATETFGVRALSAQVAEKFGVDSVFLPHSTGL
ncbi:Nif3-like dinuclear metal center hexameric protein [Verrucomicrobiaceae bacterium N1E253]|uniref:GTP cyclohydrolase 1 type 2 homolog n=1 Tax=Oceaniferula marina TaxID=2748318 RepID=A0A851GIW9_9BACT|nr:Nif3-like dinuclear metal center hexameric protein [Oceaniferula marina]NWK57453.1 Nif3-like dinuclear metal center hexameric protein [Oceaniferula marina]